MLTQSRVPDATRHVCAVDEAPDSGFDTDLLFFRSWIQILQEWGGIAAITGASLRLFWVSPR